MTRRTRASSSGIGIESPRRLLRSQNNEDAFLELPNQIRCRTKKNTATSDNESNITKSDADNIEKASEETITITSSGGLYAEPRMYSSIIQTRRSSRMASLSDEDSLPLSRYAKKVDSPKRKAENTTAEKIQMRSPIKTQSKKLTKEDENGEDKDDEVKDEESDEDDCGEMSEEFAKLAAEYRTRNLRSSGIKCDPDFYTLSLDLEIRRPRQNKSTNKNNDDLESSPEKSTSKELNDNEAENVNEQTKGTNVNAEKTKEAKAPITIKQTQPNFPQKPTPKKPVVLQHVLKDEDPNEPPPLFEDEANSESDVYCFESEHVALRQNLDYHQLLQTVAVLEAQRKQALDDIETLEKKRAEALKNPLEFVEKLQNGVDLGLPNRQKIAQLPKIDWSKYTSAYGTFHKVFTPKITDTTNNKPSTRKKQINFATGVPLQGEDIPATTESKEKQHGPRSRTFKMLWSVEEQRKLEDLLRKYPTEPNEFNRYRKIAAELKNRTPLQVQSRVQKYFIKLAKAGHPIPGRMPNLDRIHTVKRKMVKTKRHKDSGLLKMSTFFTKFHVPVRMQDNMESDNEEDDHGWTSNLDDEVSDEDDIPQEMRFSDEYLEIMRLKKIRKEKLGIFQGNGNQVMAEHTGFECDMCRCNPIKGVRYHCIDCDGEDAVDLCQSCVQWKGRFETGIHKSNHRLEPVYKAECYTDADYTNFMSRTGEYNYLDPNYAVQ